MKELLGALLVSLLGFVSTLDSYQIEFRSKGFQQEPDNVPHPDSVPAQERPLVQEKTGEGSNGLDKGGQPLESRLKPGMLRKSVPSFMGALIYWDLFGPKFLCTVTVIDRSSVFTSAHCLIDLPDYYFHNNPSVEIVLGLPNLSPGSLGSFRRRKNHTTGTFIMVPKRNYQYCDRKNDIAILAVGDVNLSNYSEPLTLMSHAKFGKNLKVAGWGDTECFPMSGLQLVNNLREVIATLVAAKKCNGLRHPLHISMQFCAKLWNNESAVSVIEIDEGAPLYSVRKPTQPKLAGILSRPYYYSQWTIGPQCMNKTLPIVFPRVSTYWDFISQHAPGAEF